MSMHFNQLQPALQNLLQGVVRFFHPRSSCTTTHILADVQRITLNALCLTILGGRTKQLDIFCCITGFTSIFLSFLVVELIQFFHGALQLLLTKNCHFKWYWICWCNKLCAWRDTICLRLLQVDNIFAFICQMALLFQHNNIFVFVRQVAPVAACWLFKTSATSWPLIF